MKKLFFLTICVVFCVCACVPTPSVTQPKEIVLGYSQLGAESGWRVACTQSIQESARNDGIQLQFSDAQQKFENQVKAIRTFIISRVDVIAFSPIVRTGWDSVLKEAKQAGIPVLLIDRDIETDDPTLFTSWAGSDFFAEGISAGEFIKTYCERENFNAKIVEILGTEGSAPEIGRREGFASAIESFENAEIVRFESGDFMNSRGYEIGRNLIESKLDFNTIFSHNDSMTMGVIKAFEEMGIETGKDIIIISVDGEQVAIDALRAGKINCVVECNPMLGNTVMDMVQKLCNNQEIPRKIFTPETVFTMYDDLSALPHRGY